MAQTSSKYNGQSKQIKTCSSSHILTGFMENYSLSFECILHNRQYNLYNACVLIHLYPNLMSGETTPRFVRRVCFFFFAENKTSFQYIWPLYFSFYTTLVYTRKGGKFLCNQALEDANPVMEVNTHTDHGKHFRIAVLFQLVLRKIIPDRQGQFGKKKKKKK